MAGRKGRSGRKPKPSALHLVQGTHRTTRHGSKDRIKAAAKKAKASRRPSPPAWLPPKAKTEWKRMAPRLHERGMLTPNDVVAFANYCRAYADLQEAQQDIKKLGRVMVTEKGYPVTNPAIGQANAAAKLCQTFLTEFGLSPSSRVRFDGKGEKPEAETIAAAREAAANRKGRA